MLKDNRLDNDVSSSMEMGSYDLNEIHSRDLDDRTRFKLDSPSR